MFVNSERLTIREIKEKISKMSWEDRKLILEELKADSRKGVQNLVQNIEKEVMAEEQEKARLKALFQREDALRNAGYRFIAGMDEAGRGPLAGPVVAACVILPEDCFLPNLNDSKKLSAQQREELQSKIKKLAVAWSVGLVNHKEIDQLNIYQATRLAMVKALRALKVRPDYLLLDALQIDTDIPQKSIIHGDRKCASIAAASIIAKTYRDRIMEIMDDFYPEYGFKENKGYGTMRHIEALKLYGPSRVHRKSFLRNIC